MNCLIIDKVYAGIAEEFSKYMNVKTADNLPSTKEQLIAQIGDVDVLVYYTGSTLFVYSQNGEE